MEENIISIKQAIKQLGICRATLYNRMSALGIQPIKKKHKAYIALNDFYQLADKKSIIEELSREKAKNQHLQDLLAMAKEKEKSYQQAIKQLSLEKTATKKKSLWHFLSK